jgi:mono/diheme cytochrome c family protein
MLMHRHVLAAVLLCVACRTDKSSAAPVDQPEDPESPPKAMPMAEHFVQGEEIRIALIAGDLEKAKQPAQWLVDNLVTEDMPVRWRAHVPKVKRNAKKIVDATEIVDAAKAAGKLGEACGECHADIGIQLSPPDRPTPLKDDTTFAQMDRHSYAAERLWDGLVGSMDDAWTEGATLMRDAPLHGDAAPEPVMTLAASVHDLATSSLELKPADRGERFGEIISTCATCHGLTKGAQPAPAAASE